MQSPVFAIHLETKSRYMRPQNALNQTQLSTSVTRSGRYRLLGRRPAEDAVAWETGPPVEPGKRPLDGGLGPRELIRSTTSTAAAPTRRRPEQTPAAK